MQQVLVCKCIELACLVPIKHGPALTVWTLNPTSDPTVEVVSDMEDLRVVENQPAEFICQFSRPVKAQWKKDGQPLKLDGRRVVVEQDWNVARLYFSHVYAKDRGSYSCEAEGTSVVASLHVEGELSSTWKEHQCPQSPLLPLAHSQLLFLVGKHCPVSNVHSILLLCLLQPNPSPSSRVWKTQRPLMEVKLCLSAPCLALRAETAVGCWMGSQWRNLPVLRLWHLRAAAGTCYCSRSCLSKTVAQWPLRLAQRPQVPNSLSEVNKLNQLI